jgi:DNA-binding MarR family transcriptional regulator
VTRREISISLTAAGREVLQRYDDLRLTALRSRLDQLTPRQRASAVDAFRDLASTSVTHLRPRDGSRS